jgi:hypothetical protein
MGHVDLTGPDVLLIGWIPFSPGPPHGGQFPPGLPSRLLFQSGNPDPPIAFRDYSGFANWIYPLFPVGTKEYRIAMYLEGVTARFFDDGTTPAVDCVAYDTFIGYTPLRPFIGVANLFGPVRRTGQYLQGHGPVFRPTQSPDPNGGWVELFYRAEFKLSFLPNLFSRALTGFWAPYAWCEIVYRIDKHKNVTVRADGTAVPSQRLYIDWGLPTNSIHEYDMRVGIAAHINAFLQTAGPGCMPAPGRGQGLSWVGPTK